MTRALEATLYVLAPFAAIACVYALAEALWWVAPGFWGRVLS